MCTELASVTAYRWPLIHPGRSGPSRRVAYLGLCSLLHPAPAPPSLRGEESVCTWHPDGSHARISTPGTRGRRGLCSEGNDTPPSPGHSEKPAQVQCGWHTAVFPVLLPACRERMVKRERWSRDQHVSTLASRRTPGVE